MRKSGNWTRVPFSIALVGTFVAIGITLQNGEPRSAAGPGLPKVRYRIHLPRLPANSTFGEFDVLDMNNAGDIVGLYSSARGITAFLYAPARNIKQAIDLNDLAVDGIPEGAWLRAGFAINEWGVVVGCLQQANGDVHPFALDLGADTPVVDLLPNFGAAFASGSQINENGDIIVRIENPRSAYLFNPGLYNGDTSVRASRDGEPQDFSAKTPQLLPAHISTSTIQLNNPLGKRPAQVAGVTNDHIAFRYTTGKTPHLETFPKLGVSMQSHIEGINDAGVFCGVHFGFTKDGDPYRGPFRYDQSVEILRWGVSEPPLAINASGDLLTWEHFYRDDCGFVRISDIVTGTVNDLDAWHTGTFTANCMTDRGTIADAAQIVGRLDGSFENSRIVILTPELVSE